MLASGLGSCPGLDAAAVVGLGSCPSLSPEPVAPLPYIHSQYTSRTIKVHVRITGSSCQDSVNNREPSSNGGKYHAIVHVRLLWTIGNLLVMVGNTL